MKISLVECGSSREEFNEPIGIELLSGVLKKTFDNMVQIFTYSLQLTPLKYCISELITSEIVGISAQMGAHINLHVILEQLFSNQGQQPLIVVGNILPTFACEILLLEYPDIICVLGEGEDSIIGITEAVFLHSKSRSLIEIKHWLISKNTPNLAVNIDGKVVYTERSTTDLSKVAHPSRDLLSETLNRQGIVRIESSRGCPWRKCSFCSINARYGSGEWRPFPIRYVIDELEDLSKFGVVHPYFSDEDFIGDDIERIIQLSREIISAISSQRIKSNLGFFISTSVRTINQIGNEKQIAEFFSLLKQAGLREVFLGIESGCRTQLLRYRKGVRPELNAKMIKVVSELGILVDPGFIMFDPEMSLDELEMNLQFIRNSGLDNIDGRLTKSLIVLPKTVLADELFEKGLVNHFPTVSRMFYSYKFLDPHIQIIFETFNHWEAEAAKHIYAIQGRMRGEVFSEKQSITDRETLRNLRKLDITFLEKAISLLRINKQITSKILRKNIETLFQFSDKRNAIIREAIKDNNLNMS
jgi:radical SAM superfamily enzyme YgiQ (UPF0313 family)